MALAYVQIGGQHIFPIPDIIFTWVKWVIPVIFFVRAIGDFKNAGLFKKVKDTKFAIADTKYFTPLCLLISTIATVVAVS